MWLFKLDLAVIGVSLEARVFGAFERGVFCLSALKKTSDCATSSPFSESMSAFFNLQFRPVIHLLLSLLLKLA